MEILKSRHKQIAYSNYSYFNFQNFGQRWSCWAYGLRSCRILAITYAKKKLSEVDWQIKKKDICLYKNEYRLCIIIFKRQSCWYENQSKVSMKNECRFSGANTNTIRLWPFLVRFATLVVRIVKCLITILIICMQ